MKTSKIAIGILTLILLAGCGKDKNSSGMTASIQDNPLVKKSTLQYQAPEFDKITDDDFKPAFEYGLKRQTEEVDSIANNPAAPTFENTVVALETSGEVLKRATLVFHNLTSADTNEKLQKLEEEYAPKFAAQDDEIYLNSKLYERINTLYNQKDKLGLQGEDLRLLEYYKEEFEMAGAGLSDENKSELKNVNQSLAELETAFSNKLLGARKKGALLVDDKAKLDGLSEDEIEDASQAASDAGQEGKYLINLTNTTQQPALQNLTNRTTREDLFTASWTRAEHNDEYDTRETIKKIALLRLKKAQLMGKKNFAEWKLQDQMAQTPERALDLLKQLATPSVQRAAAEGKDIQKLIDEQGGGFDLEAYDWNFYAEQVRKAKYNLQEDGIKPYFEVRTVLEKGVFYAAEQLYGITFKERPDLPVYHPDVVAYEVFDHDGQSIALYYLDFYTRDNKQGGAWMNNYVDQSHLLNQKPVVTNVFNFQKPMEGKPSLISFDDVETMFHEFGHAIHGIFANEKYVSLSGTNVPRDFVEFPSQINEKWALEPKVLKNYALHYQTGEAIPQALVDKIKKASNFNEGYAMTELVAAATLDMMWHTITDENQVGDVLEFEQDALTKNNLWVPEVPTRYHSPYFLHIWSNGYSAGYYAYMWSEMLDFDAYKWFTEHGGMTRANGDRFRKDILSVGNSMDLNDAFKNFTGHDPTIQPFLEGRGLTDIMSSYAE